MSRPKRGIRTASRRLLSSPRVRRLQRRATGCEPSIRPHNTNDDPDLQVVGGAAFIYGRTITEFITHSGGASFGFGRCPVKRPGVREREWFFRITAANSNPKRAQTPTPLPDSSEFRKGRYGIGTSYRAATDDFGSLTRRRFARHCSWSSAAELGLRLVVDRGLAQCVDHGEGSADADGPREKAAEEGRNAPLGVE